MPRRTRLRQRLLISLVAVIAVGAASVFVVVGLVAPGAFDAAMSHASGDPMDEMMQVVIRAAFQDAVQTALVVAVGAATVTAIIVSVALSARLSEPIARLAAASRRIAEGHYAERVAIPSSDEIGDLAESFNRMAESLESTERRRLQLVVDVTHEFRTPLTTLDGYLEGLEDGVIQPIEPTWKLLRGETARLSHLVDDLQQLWRAEARQLQLSFTTVDVRAALDSVRERFVGQATEHGIELRLDLPAGPLSVLADQEKVAQILDNFASNAIRYSPAGTSVVFVATADPDAVVIGVTDQGPGLTNEQRERVFERFYRIDPSRSRALGGSGIGLATARALSEAMGGRVWAESEVPGRGSTFRLALPKR